MKTDKNEKSDCDISKIRGENFSALLGLVKLKRGDFLYSNQKIRTHKNDFQKAVLTEVFNITRFPSAHSRDDLALLLNHTTRGIQIWFQNNRHNLSLSENDTLKTQNSTDDIFENKQLKKKTVPKDVLCDIVENSLSKKSRRYWDKVINYVPRIYKE